MKQVIVEQFGGPEVLKIVELPTPEPGPGMVRVRITSIGMNHAELMGRRGEYKLSTGDPPFTPGLEAGGVIDAVGKGVITPRVGDRVVLGPDVPRLGVNTAAGASVGGTYRTHYVCEASKVFPAPALLPHEQLGAVWLPYLTAWGCLVWKHRLHEKPQTRFVALPAASSSVALAAAQIVKHVSPRTQTIGLTTSADKVATLQAMPESKYDHLIVTRDDSGRDIDWRREVARLTGNDGVDVFFDPVGSGDYLNSEIRSLSMHGSIYVYGLLGKAGVVDVTPLMRKFASIHGWVLSELVMAGAAQFTPGCLHILEGFAQGVYRQKIGQTFRLDDVQAAHRAMETGRHIGKLVLVP